MAKQPSEAEARKRVEQAEEQLGEARTGLQAAVARGGTPHVVVEVLPDNTVWHNGEAHGPGDRFAVEGLTAVGMMQQGHVSPVGLHPGELDDAETVRKRTIENEKKALRARIKELDEVKT